ncbi:M16 family metallopeptidase [Paenibacillus allorhizosphaerae]|uniref:Zinc protease n=1 Tax=Paenibacillus allorhizosphaerae TaxID=2849866 RepID=A0ABN7TP13_9BACL|nr:pitrilysin family protein [Paenibacillus allorhizosphaerae]CAG7644346.1 putative zinc protease [Paenibacillus allorhizosphaerae]
MNKTVLSNGLTVITEHQEKAVSTLICYWVKAGGHHELNYPFGIAHFLEHMRFKGTASRSKERIMEEVSEIGGRLNASTSPEWTRYFIYTPYDEWQHGTEFLTDLIFGSIFPEQEIAIEKSVVIEEIKRAEDNPQMYGSRLLLRMLRGMHPERAGNLGTESSVTSITRDDLIRFNREYYQPHNIVLVVTGHIDHGKLVAYLESIVPPAEGYNAPPKLEKLKRSKLDGRTVYIERDIRQAQLHWGMYGPDRESPDRYAGYVAVRLLQSRLTKEIRTERGLAYAVTAEMNTMFSEGAITGYAAAALDRIDEVKRIIVAEFIRLKTESVPEDELFRAKKSITGRHLIAEDQRESLNARLASEHIFGVSFDPVEFADRVLEVEADDVMRFAETYFQDNSMLFVQVSKDAGESESNAEQTA